MLSRSCHHPYLQKLNKRTLTISNITVIVILQLPETALFYSFTPLGFKTHQLTKIKKSNFETHLFCLVGTSWAAFLLPLPHFRPCISRVESTNQKITFYQIEMQLLHTKVYEFLRNKEILYMHAPPV